MPDRLFSARKQKTPSPELANKVPVAARQLPKCAWGHLMRVEENFDVSEKRTKHESLVIYDVSYRQPCQVVKYRPFPKRKPMWELRRVKDEQRALLKKNLKALMAEANIGARPLAERIGLGATAVRDIIEGHSLNPRIGTLSAIADFFNVSVTYLLGAGDVVVIGNIGAGGSISYEDSGDRQFVPSPPDVEGHLVGLEVVGESMMPKFDPGDVIYICESEYHDPDDLIGSYCACRLATGETYLKQLARSSVKGCYTLRSLNAEDMEDQELEWALPVRAILPRFARRFS